MRRTILAFAALSLSLPLPAAAKEARVTEIAPSSPWNVDFAENKCRLVRLFGEGDKRHVLFFEQYSPGDQFLMVVAGPSFSRFRDGQTTHLKFFEAQAERDTTPFLGKLAQNESSLIFSTVSIIPTLPDAAPMPEQPRPGIQSLDKEAAKQVTYISLRQRDKDVRLMTGPLDKAFAVLDDCALDLVRSWGLDVEQQRAGTRRPKWLNQEEVAGRIVATYPAIAAMQGEQGIMRLRVIVSAEGTVESCTIIKATKTDALESPACRQMKAARFEPALDAAGKPMRSYYATGITYVMSD